MRQTFFDLFKAFATETGADLTKDLSGLALYASERSKTLANAIGQPGFDEAVQAERDNVAGRAGIRGIRRARDAERQLLGLIQGALVMAASTIAGANTEE